MSKLQHWNLSIIWRISVDRNSKIILLYAEMHRDECVCIFKQLAYSERGFADSNWATKLIVILTENVSNCPRASRMLRLIESLIFYCYCLLLLKLTRCYLSVVFVIQAELILHLPEKIFWNSMGAHRYTSNCIYYNTS